MKSIRDHMGKNCKTPMILRSLCIKFNLMKGGFEKSLFNTIFSNFFQSFVKGILTLFNILKLDALDAHCESRLFSCVIITITWTEVRGYSSLNNSLIEGRVRAFKEKIRKNLHAE
jgi:hypothetical protein